MWTWTAFLLVRLPVILRELSRKFCQLRELMFNIYMILLRWEFSVHLTCDYRKSSIKSSLPNKPSLFRERKLAPSLLRPPSLPVIYSSLTNDRLYYQSWLLWVYCNCKTSCGLIQDGLFTSWMFGFVFDPGLHNLKLHVLELFRFAL